MNQCVFILRIIITKDKILPFSNYKVRIYNFLQNFAAYWSRNTGVDCTSAAHQIELIVQFTAAKEAREKPVSWKSFIDMDHFKRLKEKEVTWCRRTHFLNDLLM
jgi:hypothetical protein